MDKRYQVFVSSTFADLQDERRRVIQTLMEMDCIPSGMELFPAADEEQWAFIKRVIDDCDYYLLIIGGRYGSTTAEGVSYTEKEYDYAIEKGLQVIAMLHENPDSIPVGKSEIDPEMRGRLAAFRDKVAKNRLIKFWTKADELPGMVALSLSKTIKTHPATGWVRADQTSNTQLLSDLNDLRKQKEELAQRIAELSKRPQTEMPANLASLDEEVEFFGTNSVWEKQRHSSTTYDWKGAATWREIFGFIAPYVSEYAHDSEIKKVLARALLTKSGRIGTPALDDQVYQTIKLQLQAVYLVEIRYLKTAAGTWGYFWTLTDAGKSLMFELRTVKSGQRNAV